MTDTTDAENRLGGNVAIPDLIRIAADMVAAIPNDELGDEPAVSVQNALSALIRQAAGIPEDLSYVVDDAIAWQTC